jgi:hypothetical protein
VKDKIIKGLTDYHLKIDATAFDDATGNSYAGISNATTLNFTTIVTNQPSPLDKKDVIGSIKVWSGVSSRWATSSIESACTRYIDNLFVGVAFINH